ncbi:MAG: hypothetical protein K8S99_18340 [Planctomycetes bacterium]|nr:hypothetical protein [Planctomycetota bacterium]
MSIRQLSKVVPALLLALVLANRAAALTTVSFEPTDSTGAGDSNYHDLEDLEHQYAYRWGINYFIPSGMQVSAARLTFTNMKNWDNNAFSLYVRMIDTTSSQVGVTKFADNPNDNVFADYFASTSPSLALTTYTDVNTPSLKLSGNSGNPVNLTYNFTSGQLSTLVTYMSNGYFGFGFDPDCHFYNDGIKLLLDLVPTGGGSPPPTPEPATAALGVLSIGGLIFSATRRRKA